ncbi:MAG: hypothetical protein QXP77_01360 [Candidatus Aenigmatarchaeota archaeon]
MWNKAQTFSFEFFIALTIFLIGFSLLIIFWNYTNIQIYEKRSSEELIDIAFSLSQIFFIDGYPKEWSLNDVKVIGLASENRINQTKLYFLSSMGYENVRAKLKMDSNFFFKIHNQTQEFYFFGRLPSEDSIVVKIDRLGILNSTPVIIEVVVWK